MHRFAEVHQFNSTEVEYDAFILIIQNLDNAFLDVQGKRIERDRKGRERSSGARPIKRHRR
jgi:hypothetical protein